MTLTFIVLTFIAAVIVGLIVYGISSLVPFLKPYRNWIALVFTGAILLFALLIPALDKAI